MAVITVGSTTRPTVLGGSSNVTTGAGITTIPTTTPVVYISDGVYSDSYWKLVGGKLVPVELTYPIGLGVVGDGDTTLHVLLFDDNNNLVKKMDGSLFELKTDIRAWSTITGTPTTLSGYGITDAQPLATRLTNIAALSGTWGFVIKTDANSFGLDQNTYLTTATAASTYELKLPACSVAGYILSGNPNGSYSWVELPASLAGGVTDHGQLTGKADDDHTQYALLSGRAADILKMNHINEVTTNHGVVIDGVLIKDGDITIFYE
jgi:hypothetical protein